MRKANSPGNQFEIETFPHTHNSYIKKPAFLKSSFVPVSIKHFLKILKLTMFFKFTAVQICIRDMYRALLITAMESNLFQSLWLQENTISTKKKQSCE